MKSIKKSLSPLISVILLIVISVILIILMLTWGKGTTTSNLEKTNDIFKEDTSLTGFIYTEKAKEDSFFLKNLSSKPITFTHYQLVGDDNFFIYNYKLSLDPITVSAGSSFPIPVICSPSSEYAINLITEEGNYVSVTVKNVKDYENNPCSVPNIPSPVCLGLEENGTGEDENHLRHICNINDLDAVRNNLDGHYILGANIDMNVSPYNEGEGWEPIGSCGENQECYNGNYTYAFIGTFDGGGYTISNLYINKPYTENVGLFGVTGNATITNVKLENVDINGYIYVGGLVGAIYSSSITNSYSTGSVSGWSGVGGLVGESSGEISNSYSTGFVSGDYGVGGLVGFLDSSSIENSYSTGFVSGDYGVGGLVGSSYVGFITNSYSTGSVSGESNVGGLVGSSEYSSISNSYSTGSVSGTGYSVGGLVGSFNEGSITNSYSTGFVSGDWSVGGLVGSSSDASISSSYSTGSVSGSDTVGGLVGNSYEGFITNSYSTGSVSGDGYVGGLVGYSYSASISRSYSTGSVSGSYAVGGLVGYSSDGPITNSYSTGSVSGESNVGGLIGSFNEGSITNSYSTGSVSGTGSVGGLVGSSSRGSISNSYYDKDTSGQTDTGKGIPKTTTQMKTQSTFTGWDFTNVWKIISGVNNGYPHLVDNPPQ